MDELEKIKLKKLRELEERIRKQQQQIEEMKRLNLEKKRLMTKILEYDALEYLNQLNQTKPTIASTIQDILVGAVLSGRIYSKVTRLEIMALERKIEGKGPEIKVKRRGQDLVDLSTELKKDD
ncbi:MAG: DNA-binding protein [Candidatus Odinarchaeia archaeon]